MKLADTPENRATLDILTNTGRLVDWMRNDIGQADYGTSRVPYGVGGRGGSDYLGVIKPPHKSAGRWIACEIKRAGGKPDIQALDARIAARDYCPGSCRHERCKLVYQRLFHLRVMRSGGIALFADCAADVLKALETA